jgi:hypothetical protein
MHPGVDSTRTIGAGACIYFVHLLQERLRASSERTEEEGASLSAGEKCSDTLILLSAYNIGKVSV